MSAKVDVIQARAHLMQQINDHTRNGYRWWVTGTVPLAKAHAWAEKAESIYDIGLDRNARARRKKAKLGSAYMYMYPLDRSLDNQRLGWTLLVTDGLHPAHAGEKLHRAEDDPVEIFGYHLVREPRAGKAQPVWTWRMKRDAYDAWRDRIIDVVRRGSDYDIRQMLRQLRAAPGFSAIRLQIKALHRLVTYEWKRRHKKGQKPQFVLPRIYKCPRMEVVRVDLSTYLRALAERRKEAAAEATESAALAPKVEPESIYLSEAPAEQDRGAPPNDAHTSEPSSTDAPASSASTRRLERRAKRKDASRDRAQPVRQRALPLPSPTESDAVPPWEDSASSPASDPERDADDAVDDAAGGPGGA